MTVEEVAEYLRLPLSTTYKFAQDHLLPGIKIGKHWRFRREAILKWLLEQEKINSSNRAESISNNS